jgi:O-antigen polysaccharide polymerase Wzy
VIPEGHRIIWLGSGALGLALIVFVARRGLWRQRPAQVAYASLLWFFHLGLTFPAALMPGIVAERPGWAVDWLFTPAGTLAVVEATTFLACFIVGSELGYRRPGSAAGAGRSSPELALVGDLWIGAGLILFFVCLYRHGIEALLAPYDTFFPVFSLDFSRAVLVAGFGALLVLASGSSLLHVRWTLALFAVVATPVFLVGGRSAPMFVTVALVVVAVQRGMVRRFRRLVVAAVLLLSAMAVVRVSRERGLTAITDAAAESGATTPVAGLAELGGSLAPVWAVIDSEQRWGRQYSWGETYLFPLSRGWARLAGAERIDPETDPRFIADFTDRQYGSIGFSTVAEAYANGGTVGVVLFASAWGVLLGWLERSGGTPYGRARLAVVLLPMLYDVRNSFIFVPAWVGTGLAVIGVAYVLRGKRLDGGMSGRSSLANRPPLRVGRRGERAGGFERWARGGRRPTERP